jgi:hypothetical protein
MTPIAIYITPKFIASARKGRGTASFEGTVRFFGVDELPFTTEHVCLIDRDTALEALFDAVRDAQMLLDAV